MNNTEIEIIMDLAEINNDRVAGYDKALMQTNDPDLQTIFKDMSEQSKQFSTALNNELKAQGEKKDYSTTLRGKIYRTWMDIKSAFGADDRKHLLDTCKFGEDAAVRAYEQALEEGLPAATRSLVMNQYESLRRSQNRIRSLKSQAAAGR